MEVSLDTQPYHTTSSGGIMLYSAHSMEMISGLCNQASDVSEKLRLFGRRLWSSLQHPSLQSQRCVQGLPLVSAGGLNPQISSRIPHHSR